MGATKKPSNNKLYLKVYEGAFRKWVPEPTDESKQRKSGTGKVINEELFSAVNGKLKKIYIYEEVVKTDAATFDLSTLVIEMQAEGDKEATCIQLPAFQSFGVSFLTRLPNIKLDEEFTLKPYTIKNEKKSEAKGKEIFNDYLIPYQGFDKDEKEIKVNSYFTEVKDGKTVTINGLPEIVVKYKKDKTVSSVDTAERDEFLAELVKDVNEKLKASVKVAAPAVAATGGTDDDLPF